jgi:autoinducer 2-degrading protein
MWVALNYTQETAMYSVLAHITIYPHQVEEFITLVRQYALEYLRDEPGTLRYDVIQDENDPTHFYFHETYADQAAFHTHMQGPIGQSYMQQAHPLISSTLDNSVFLGRGVNVTPAES